MRDRTRGALRLALALSLGLLLTACVSMQAVNDYSAASRKTLEGVQTIGRDYSASCLRMDQYKPRTNDKNVCAKEKTAGKGISNAALALNAYVSGLGALAADDNVAYNSQIDDLASSVKTSGIMPSNQADAFGGLAKLLSRALLDGYKQKQIRLYVDRADPDVTIASRALADVVGKFYVQYIKAELETWDFEYRELERVQKQLKPLEWQIYSEKKWQERLELEAKIAAAESLAGNVLAIGTAHSELRMNAGRLDSKELSAVIKAYVDAAIPVIKEVDEAFKQGGGS
ncbi:MAG: hypothetical protein Q8O35_03100 [Humidesulfovibrio sp.]|jgi:hypothetical protein|nr:hypothetical protein [Humidesulfovibrio sp.]